MKKFLFVFFIPLAFFSHTTVAQNVRVFEHLTVNTVFGNSSFIPTIAYTQSIAFGNRYNIRVSTGIRYSNYLLNKQTLDGQSQSENSRIELTRRIGNSGFNIPIGIETGNKLFAIGVNADLMGISFGKSRGVESFNVLSDPLAIEEPTITSKTFNFLPTLNGTLNTQMYLSVSPNPMLSIKVGMAYTQVEYVGSTIVSTEKKEWDTFKQSNFSPFLGLQFNFER